MYLLNPQDVGPAAGVCPHQSPHHPHRLALLRRPYARQAVGAEHGLVGLEGRGLRIRIDLMRIRIQHFF